MEIFKIFQRGKFNRHSKKDREKFQRDFLKRVNWGHMIPDTIMGLGHNMNFWVKDDKHRFVLVNENVRKIVADVELDKKLKQGEVSTAIGKNDLEFAEPKLAEVFQNDDLTVMKTQKPVKERLELVPRPDGTIGWYNTYKYPLYDKNNNVIGTFGYSIDIKNVYNTVNPIMKMVPVINYLKANINLTIKESVLCSIAQMDRDELRQVFKKVFGMSIPDYVLKIKVENAESLLGEPKMTEAEVLHKSGFATWEELEEGFLKMGRPIPKFNNEVGA